MHMNFILSTRFSCYIISASIWIQLPHQPDNYYKEGPKERKCQKRNPKKLMAPPINFNLMQCVHLLRQGRSFKVAQKSYSYFLYIIWCLHFSFSVVFIREYRLFDDILIGHDFISCTNIYKKYKYTSFIRHRVHSLFQ